MSDVNAASRGGRLRDVIERLAVLISLILLYSIWLAPKAPEKPSPALSNDESCKQANN